MLNWGILGTGRVVDAWAAPAIAADDGSRPLAVAGRDGTRTAALARTHGFERSYGSYEELLADPDVDAVYLATPNALHVDQVVACAQRGKHVLCEKPLALSVADAERAAAACAEAGVLLRTNFQYRHHPGLQRVRELIAAGAIGSLRILQAEIGGAYPLRGWRTDPALAGMGAALNLGVHAYDLVEWLTGRRALRVAAVAAPEGGPETATLAIFELEGDLVASVNANQCASRSLPDLHVDGTDGRISALGCLRLGEQDGEVRLVACDRESCSRVNGASVFSAAIASFVAAASAGERDPGAGGGLRSAEVIEALRAAAADRGSGRLDGAANVGATR